MPIGFAQIGKQGLTINFIESLKNIFKSHDNVRISVLKSSGRDKEKIKQYSEELLDKLGKNYTARIIGFTLVLKKWRREVRK